MRQHLFVVIFVLLYGLAGAQPDSSRANNNPAKKSPWLYHRSGMGASDESYIDLVPEMSFFKNFGYGIGLSKSHFTSDGLGSFGNGITAGYGYLPNQKTSVIYVSAWFNANITLLGFYAAARALYYTGSGYKHFALRPELGYGFYRFSVFYAYSFIFGPKPETFKPGSINVAFYIPLIKGKEMSPKNTSYK